VGAAGAVDGELGQAQDGRGGQAGRGGGWAEQQQAEPEHGQAGVELAQAGGDVVQGRVPDRPLERAHRDRGGVAQLLDECLKPVGGCVLVHVPQALMQRSSPSAHRS
jgi:hypothetical protein